VANDISIRKYKASDREALRGIAVATAMVGRPGSLFMDGEDILADALTRYFTDHEPESCFVAIKDEHVVGYIIGATDTKKMDAVVFRKIHGPLAVKVLTSGALLRHKNLSLLWRFIMSFVSGEFVSPSFYRSYPATLHINLNDDARGQGTGARLMQTYLAYLKEKGVKGVQMATMSAGSAEFFLKQGFTVLFKGWRSYFRHIIGQDVPLYVFGKSIVPETDARRPL
jgi:GNAT superfamily N-acetyltransferase